MDTEHFDQLARLAGGRTRRAALRFAAAAALGGARGRDQRQEEAAAGPLLQRGRLQPGVRGLRHHGG